MFSCSFSSLLVGTVCMYAPCPETLDTMIRLLFGNFKCSASCFNLLDEDWLTAKSAIYDSRPWVHISAVMAVLRNRHCCKA